MSIIYEALKKVEHSSLKGLGKDRKEIKKKRVHYLIYVFVVIVGFFIARLIFSISLGNPLVGTVGDKIKQNNISHQPYLPAVIDMPAVVEVPLEKDQETLLPSRLSLSGIVYDGQSSYAIINNRILREGEFVEGAQLIRILSDNVELEFAGRPINLKLGN